MACPVTCQRRSASTIMSGMAIPMTANTMWKARDTPICERAARRSDMESKMGRLGRLGKVGRSEEHTSELQSRLHLVCRLLLEKKKKKKRESCQYESRR